MMIVKISGRILETSARFGYLAETERVWRW